MIYIYITGREKIADVTRMCFANIADATQLCFANIANATRIHDVYFCILGRNSYTAENMCFQLVK
jgi:hypothetical protein